MAEQETAEQAEPMSAVLAVRPYMVQAVAEVRHGSVTSLAALVVFGVHIPLAVVMRVRAILCPLAIPAILVVGMAVRVQHRVAAV